MRRSTRTELYDPIVGAKDKRDVCQAATRRLFLKYDIEHISDLEQVVIQRAIDREARENGISPKKLKEHVVFCMGRTREGGTSKYSYTTSKIRPLLKNQVVAPIDADNTMYRPGSFGDKKEDEKGVSDVTVDHLCFSTVYINKAEQVFLNPSPRYSWNNIISGTQVKSATGGVRVMFAVAQNTFRGFYRINQKCPGAKTEFIKYFLDQRAALIDELSSVMTRSQLDRLSNTLCQAVKANLTNCVPSQLHAYNKLRKPIDLYLEHLVAMAVELESARSRLVPLLFLPIDSQILSHPGIFSDRELSSYGLSRSSTYRDVAKETSYAGLQALLSRKAASVANARNRPFHVIYFDLIWNGRHNNWGGNLFETNP